MPQLALKDVQNLIDNDEVAAITLDTTTFDQFGCNLDFQRLTALEQFKGTAVTYLLSEITLGEVAAHIAKAITEAAEKARAGVNQYVKAWRGTDDLHALLAQIGVARDPSVRAAVLVEAHVQRVGATRLAVEPGASLGDITARYFEHRPPFSTKTAKKNEFPDAIALLTLESWAAAADTYVVAVSKDGDWARYAAESRRLIVIPDLAATLNLFHRESSVVASRIASVIRKNNTPTLVAAIRRGLDSYVEEFDVLANAPYYYEEENEFSHVIDWRFPEDAQFDVVAAKGDTVTLATQVEMNAEFGVRFAFSRKDPIDRDYIEFGSTKAVVTETVNVPIVMTFSKTAGEDPEPLDVEIDARSLTIDFDYVEPAWGEDAY